MPGPPQGLLQPGGVVFRPAGDTHTLTNVGETRYVARIVELKTQ